jgi:hypothetical protein
LTTKDTKEHEELQGLIIDLLVAAQLGQVFLQTPSPGHPLLSVA